MKCGSNLSVSHTLTVPGGRASAYRRAQPYGSPLQSLKSSQGVVDSSRCQVAAVAPSRAQGGWSWCKRRGEHGADRERSPRPAR